MDKYKQTIFFFSGSPVQNPSGFLLSSTKEESNLTQTSADDAVSVPAQADSLNSLRGPALHRYYIPPAEQTAGDKTVDRALIHERLVYPLNSLGKFQWRSLLSPGWCVWRSLLQCLIYSDHYLF